MFPKKKELSDDDKRRMKLVPGGLMKAELRPGVGDSTPSDGDQVIYHFYVRTLEGYVVRSTKKEFGGKGSPLRDVLGKSKLILGLLEGIPTMKKGEIAMFKMKFEMHFGESDCPVPVPENFPTESDLHFEIELIDFGKAKVISDDLGVVKKVLDANPAHAKALYRRGMAYMELGDFEEAKSDFNTMMKVDKSSEADAKVALQKLKQREHVLYRLYLTLCTFEQDAAMKAKKQFKGLFDKGPGENADVSTDKVDQEIDVNHPNKDVHEDSKSEISDKAP